MFNLYIKISMNADKKIQRPLYNFPSSHVNMGYDRTLPISRKGYNSVNTT
jgi:hypothetical protein